MFYRYENTYKYENTSYVNRIKPDWAVIRLCCATEVSKT